MPRYARKQSATGIYHVIVRGINKQDLFYDNEDMGLFLQRLVYYKEECHFELYGYCMMTNHVHLLIKETDTTISEIMKKLGTSYVHWYNWKYERSGHLFQDRFISEPVESDEYLLTVLRYIHQNPQKAKIISTLESYEWSSYNRYLDNTNKIVDSKMVMDMLGGRERFKDFMFENANDVCLEAREKNRYKDEEVTALLKSKYEVKNPLELQNMSREKRNIIISALKSTDGISYRQIERITGIGRGAIEKCR